MSPKYALFISFAKADRPWVEDFLLEALNGEGVRVLVEDEFIPGVPRLVEFERAIQESGRTLLVLSPAYLADGFTQFVDVLSHTLGAETHTWPVIPLLLEPVDLPLRLRQLVALDASNPELWPEVLERLFRALETPIPAEATNVPSPGKAPYRGLEFFDVADTEWYFGRDGEIADLIARLNIHSLLAVVGASGSGKSSLVRAGVLPVLRGNRSLDGDVTLPMGSTHWPVHIITPTARPLERLAASLTRDLESVTATATLLDDLRADPRALHLYTQKLLAKQTISGGKGGGLLLVVDQFEELFTTCKDPEERRIFIENLLYATSFLPSSESEGNNTAVFNSVALPTRIILTLRADFYHHCAQHPALFSALETCQANVPAISTAGLRRAIEEPARKGGWSFAPGLVDTLLRDVGAEGSRPPESGALPLLSHALLETWKRRRGRQLTLAGYDEAGRVQGAIAKTADRVYRNLPPERQLIARTIFLRLTELGEGVQDTRRRAALDELIPTAASRPEVEVVEAVLKELADQRLVTTGAESVDVAHEALIREWPALRRWLDENRESLRLHRNVTEAAHAWASLGRDPGALYRGARLNQAVEWWDGNPDALNALEREFLEASRGEEQKQAAEREAAQKRELEQARILFEEQRRSAQAQRQRTIYLTAGLIVAVFLGILSFSLYQTSNRNLANANLANTQSSFNLEQANVANTQSVANAQTSEAASTKAVSQESTAIAERNSAETAQADADEQRQFAEDQARVAQVGELSALALAQLDQKLDLALLLSVEAFETRDMRQTQNILYTAWTHNPRLAQFFQEHSGSVTSVAWSADGRLASGSTDGTVILWDLASGEPAHTLQGHSDSVTSVAWSADGRLASGSEDLTVVLWDLDVGSPTFGQPAQTLRGHSVSVTSVAWSADGRLASGSDLHTIIVWDVASGEPVQTFQGYSGSVASLAWSADGRLASGSIFGTVIVWDVASGEPVQTLKGPTIVIASVAWSSDGRLASGSHGGSVILWDLNVGSPTFGQPAQTLRGHTSDVASLAWSADGRLASGSWDHTIIIWDLASGQPAQTLQGHTSEVTSVAWSADGRLASGWFDNTVIVWDLASDQSAQTLQGHTSFVNSVAWSADERLASGSNDNTVIVWDLASGQPAQTLQGGSGQVASVAWSADGRLASGSWDLDGRVIVWDLDVDSPTFGQPAQTLQGHSTFVNSVAWSADGRLASGSWDHTIIIWDLASGEPAQTLPGHTSEVASVAWSADGRLASGSWDGSVIVWDLDVGSPTFGQPAQTLQGHSDWVVSVAWSADGRLASGSHDNTVIVWDVDVGSPTFGQPVQILQGHSGWVKSVAWSADGRLASGSDDHTIIVWDLASGQPAQTLQGHTGLVYSVAWSAGGRLASGSVDDTVIVWEVSPEVWAAQSCQRAGRNLTEAEWNQYLSWKGSFNPEYRTCPQWPPGAEQP